MGSWVSDVLVRRGFGEGGGPGTNGRVTRSSRSDWLRSKNELLSGVDPEKDMVQVCEGMTCGLVKAAELKDLLKGSRV